MTDINDAVPASTASQWSRRDLLRLGAVAGLGALGASCASQSTPSAVPETSRVRRGGVLNLACTGGSSADTLDAQNPLAEIDWSRVDALYSPLLRMNNKSQAEPALADEVIPNADGTVWTIRLKPGLTCHDGRPFTANDVLFSFKRILNPQNPLPGSTALSLLDTPNARIVDTRTLTIPCIRPFALLPEALFNPYCLMVPQGYNPKQPVGTGPFQYKSFTPGVESTFVRFADYWEAGQPYADKLIITDFVDETSQVNALLSGQVNLINLLTAASMRTLTSAGMQVVISRSGGFGPITMRVDTPPFNDVRVRQAFRLLVNRHEMLDAVFDGNGRIGNDVFSIDDPSYDHVLPQREQDISRARALLRAAGHETLNVTMTTSAGIGQGLQGSAEVFVQQAAGGGVTVSLGELPTGEYFSRYYLKAPLSQDYWYYQPYLLQVAQETISTAPFNETHWNDPVYAKLYQEALGTLDFNRRTEIIHEMQTIDYDIGGLVIPYFSPIIDGLAKDIRGVAPGISGLPLANYNWGAFWVDS
jgi:peptide/nickel transport system substrate-binding protein